jgi:uncharacterized protein YdhG (YjbR/CyaY superfamily)
MERRSDAKGKARAVSKSKTTARGKARTGVRTAPRKTGANSDEYLAAVSAEQRAALQKLRGMIRAAAPGAEECISYRLPAFRLDGKLLVAFGATANHCSFFLMSGTTVAAFADDLAGYDTSKGTIRFQPDQPLPAALVRKLVRARIAENGGAA